MIKKRRAIYCIIIFIIILITIIIVIPTIIVKIKINTIDQNITYDKYFKEREKKFYSIVSATEVVNDITESNLVKVTIKDIIYTQDKAISIKCEKDINPAKIEVVINGEKNKINVNETFVKAKLNEGKNHIAIQIKYNNEVIKQIEKDVYYIKPYENQFYEPKNRNGIMVHYRNGTLENFEKSKEQLLSLGAKSVRADFFMDVIYKNKKVDFTIYDKWEKELAKNNINILAIIGGYPDADNNLKIDNDEEISEVIDSMKVIAKHYPEIKDYEIYNELNLNSSYKNAYLGDDIIWYAKLLEKMSEEKELNSINIISGGTSTPLSDDQSRITSIKFYNNLFKYNKSITNIAFHPYADYENKENEMLKKTMDHIELCNNNGGFIKINITEYGNTNYTNTEDKKANKDVEYSVILDQFTDSHYLYDFWDTKTSGWEQFGLLTHDYLPKKSYYSMKNYYQNTNGSEYIGQIKLIDGLEAHVYDKDGKPKIIAWATDSSKPVTINYDGFSASDLYGNAIENTNGKLEITDSPVYLDNVSTNYFYQAISNSITEGYSDFNSKFKNEIAKVNVLSNKINSLNQTATSLKNMSTLDENTANNLMKSHFELGNDLINAYNNGSLNVEYVKLSSMLDSLNTIGNSYEDLITVSAKTRMKDLTDITNEVNNANSIIEKNEKLDIVYPEKIYKFSKDLLDTSSYVLGLEEENDIKTGLINSKALHAKYLANWSQEFSQLYINDAVKKPINKIIADNDAIINNTSNGISKNSDILNSYVALKNSLNNLITNEIENNLNKINNTYTNQMNLIKLIVSKYNAKELKINDNVYKSIIENFINLSDDYKELYELYKTDNDTISTKEVEETLNKVINRYNDNKDTTNDFDNETDIINNMTELFNGLFDRTQDPVIEVQSAENYLKKQRILKTCDIASSMLENDIKQKADSEYKAITISSDKGINNFTNQDETITINLPKNAQITSESGNGFRFNDNGTKDVKLSIRGYDYTYTIKINNIDKTLPKVTAQNGQSIKINAIDDNLKEIKIEKDKKETVVKNGQTITTPGIYKITATDKAGNSTNETAIVYGTYTNEQNTKVNYVTIKAKTKVRDIKQDGDYTIKDNNNIANEIKRAPSSVNTNAEKDSNSYIATGDILQDNNNTYIVITLGDLSGNGDVGVVDIIKLRKSLVGLTKLTKLQELAADTNQNGSVNVSDLLKERKIMVGME